MKKIRLAAAALAALTLGLTVAPAHAGIGIGIGVGVPAYRPYPYYYRPYYGYPYYRPYGVGVYVAPPPVVVAPPPVYVAQPPVVVQPAPVTVGAPPAPVAAAPTQAYAPASTVAASPPSAEMVSAPAPAQDANYQGAVQQQLQTLASGDERGRADAAVELGRMRAEAAVDRLSGVLGNDPSTQVREAAARALGLIGSPRGMNALRYAAQADNDRDVRRSAQFSLEIITTNMRR